MLRFFCPIHEVGFETADERKVLCEITGHALALDFPRSEVWEFCCNCSTFAPSGLGKGEKARSHCFSCQNEISTRYLCSECQTVSFECGKKSRKQQHFVATSGIEPDCPACRSPVASAPVVNHECDEIDSKLLTARGTCPFCLDGTNTGFTMPGRNPSNVSGDVCPSCQHVNRPESVFCSKCRYQLKSDAEVSARGSGVERSKLLDSLCPTCSMPIPKDADFCGECGQAVRRADILPPPPPPPPPPRRNTKEPTTEAGTVGRGLSEGNGMAEIPASLPTGTGRARDPRLFIGLIGGGLVLGVIISAAIMRGDRTTDNANWTYTNANNTRPANARTPATNVTNSAANPAPANANVAQYAHPLIGKSATLYWDVPIREYPNKDLDPAGFHYRGAQVRVIDVDEDVLTDEGGTARWVKIEVVRPGTSIDPNNVGLTKDYGTPDIGWLAEKRTIWTGSNRTHKERNRQMLIYDR